MRVTDAANSRTLIENLNSLYDQLAVANEAVSSGKRLTHLHTSPADSAQMVELNNQLNQLDQFQTNSDTSGYYLQVSETTLNSLYDLVTAIYTRGSEAASGTNDANSLATLGTEIRSLRDQAFSLANTKVKGRYLFAGSQVGQPAFTIAGDVATYHGDTVVNKVDISNGLQVDENIPGSDVFSPIFAATAPLLAAIDSGDQAGIQSALSGFAGALSTLNQVRTRLGVDLGKLQDTAVARQNIETNIKTLQSNIGDANIAEAVSRLSALQNALQAALSAGALTQKYNLFDFLG